MAPGDVIYPDVVLLEAESSSEMAAANGTKTAAAVVEPGNGDLSLRAAQARHIASVLSAMDGCKRRAARALGVSRSTLDRKLAESPKGKAAGEAPMAGAVMVEGPRPTGLQP
jgi:DNA-binding NtrC family response regulator